jgi:ABC-type transport system involved in multi-copper enzyme maturation permease subunit
LAKVLHMHKYLAVIRDSFREAMASRVLWLALVLITLILVVVAPLGFREELTWRLGDNDVREWPDLMELVRKTGKEEEATPAGRIWALLDDSLQSRLTEVKIPQKDQKSANPFVFLGVFRDFRRSVNELLERPDLYDELSFQEVQLLSSEWRALREKGLENLSEIQTARFNRLLLEASFPDLVRGSPPTSIQFLYGWLEFGPPFPLRGDTLKEALQTRVVNGMNWFVGAIGICVAILFTAPIIPQMFDAGSLHLLLSKPISRWLLFLAKFLGGCSFIVIAASYLIGGFWLVLGLRFDVWDPKLLWSIPIYLFVFAIYYSVSALVGVIWRSPIVCVALTILFWLTCFVVGTSKTMFETMIWNKSRLIKLMQADEMLLAVDETGIVQRWDAEEGEWDEIFVSREQRQSRGILLFLPVIPRQMRPIGPIYDSEHGRLVSVQPSIPPTSLHLYVGQREEDWDAVSNITAPTGTLGLFRETTGSLLAVSSMGIYRLRADPLIRQKPIKIFGMTIPLNLGGPFRNVSPDPPVLLTQPAAAALHPESGDLCVYTRGKLTLLGSTSAGIFELGLERELDGQERQPVVLALAGRSLVVGRDDGRVQIFDAATLEIRREFQPSGSNQPRFISASSDGRLFAIVLHNGQLWLYDDDAQTLAQPSVAGQGDISAATIIGSETLLVADRTVRVSRYKFPLFELEQRFSPKLGLLGSGYRYGLVPLYTLFPKPGELDKLIQFLLSGEETERPQRDDLAAAQREIDPWTPLWSSAAFMFVTLLIACVYIERQEF